MKCYKCGTMLPDGTPFCPNCRTPFIAPPTPQASVPPTPQANVPPTPYYAVPPAPRVSVRPVMPGKTPEGYSLRVNSPEMVRYQEKQKQWSNIWLCIMAVVPIVGFVLYAQFSDEITMGQALAFGPCVSLIMLAFGLYPRVKQKFQKSYIGTVIDMYTKVRVHTDDDGSHARVVTTYYIVTRDTNGKKHTHKSTGYEGLFSLLRIGDEVRFLPQFPSQFEKKLSPGENFTCCVFCQKVVSLDNDTCPNCKAPLLK